MANIDQVQLPDGSQYHIIDDTSGYATTTYVQDQISTINKNTIGLGNVDNTADINKPVSLPQQAALDGKVDDDIVAYVENDTTATKRHVVGDQFILNGVLYTATAIIAVNDTIVIGTNCDSAESVATQITENANAIVSLRSDITSINQTGTTATQAISSGTYFYLNEVLVRAKTDIASGATFTENTNYEIPTDGGLNQTTANRCLMSNGNSVEQILNNLFTIKEYTIASTDLSQLSYFGANAYLGQATTETATYGRIISVTARDTSNYPCVCQVKSDNNLNVIGTASRDFIVRVVYSK